MTSETHAGVPLDGPWTAPRRLGSGDATYILQRRVRRRRRRFEAIFFGLPKPCASATGNAMIGSADPNSAHPKAHPTDSFRLYPWYALAAAEAILSARSHVGTAAGIYVDVAGGGATAR